ncbi:MAG: taurine dioxygenase [Rhodospirillaceae bacterium]|nr:taurine dioxygenase [Rhodospirillaceae bacterium]MBT5914211.1 taurine dioxygenase [Rhodospirillaceae bacterium]MBT7732301.1 taurine dioxygenase [Rhodospirillaceae bacterium]MDC0998161.1 TauD/TfdA family dioxygenase [Alphaproteobacteria bacterium]MDC1442746.1 TauD/TfdA family dioxygenase [Rhodospirillaceae bacterium]
MSDLEIIPITPLIGAEIKNIDLKNNLTEVNVKQIRSAFLNHSVLFFRDQKLSIDEQKVFGKYFGDLHIHPARDRNGIEGHPEILYINAGPNTSRVNGDDWHSDVSCDQEPPMGSILRIFEAPNNGGDTLFASMYAAYDALSEPMKRFLDPLTAVHDGGPNYIDRAKRAGIYKPDKVFPANSHPIIRTHPETGKKAIYVNKIFTQTIDSISKDESKAILEFLFQHIAKPAFQCRFKWEENSIAFWDNRCALHHAMWDYYPEVRRGYRVTIKGDKPF